MASEGPGDTPYDIGEALGGKRLGDPGTLNALILGPDEDSLVLGAGGEVGSGEANVGGKGHISNPVLVGTKGGSGGVGLGFLGPIPDLDGIIASSSGESTKLTHGLASTARGGDQGTRGNGRGPGDGIAPNAVGSVGIRIPFPII